MDVQAAALKELAARAIKIEELAKRIDDNTTPSWTGEIGHAFVTNALWEVFGFSSGQKSVVGVVFSVLGIVGMVARVLMFVLHKDSPWLNRMLVGYLLACFVVLAIFSLSNTASRLETPAFAASSLADETTRLRVEIRGLSDILSRPIEQKPAGDSVAWLTGLAAIQKDVKDLRDRVGLMQSDSESAAGKPGWGTHVALILLMLVVLGAQLFLIFQVHQASNP